MSFFHPLVRFIESHPRLALMVVGLITLIAALYNASGFRINSGLDGLIVPSSDTRWYSDNEVFKAAFPQYEKTAVVVVSGDSAEAVANHGRRLYRALQANPLFTDVFAPEYSPFFEKHALYFADTLSVEHIAKQTVSDLKALTPLYQQPTVGELAAFYRQEVARAAGPGILNEAQRFRLSAFTRTVSDLRAGKTSNSTPLKFLPPWTPRDTGETQYRMITVKSNPQTEGKYPNRLTIEAIQAAIASVGDAPGVSVRITGEVALANDEINQGLSGVELSGTLSLVILLLVLILGMRHKRLIVGVFLLLFIGIIWTLALATLLVEAFNTLSLVFLVMFFGLAVDFAVHYSLRWLDEQSANAASSAAIRTFDGLAPALCLCAFTTSLGFLAFLPTDYKGFAQLGMISALGMLVALILSLTLLPAWYALFPAIPVPPTLKNSPKRRLFPRANSSLIIACACTISGWMLWVSKDLAFDYSVLAMQDERTEAMATLKELGAREQTTDFSIAVLAEKNALSDLIPELEALPQVVGVKTPFDHLPGFQMIKQQHMVPARLAIKDFFSANTPGRDVSVNDSSGSLMDYASEFFEEDRVLIEAVNRQFLWLSSPAGASASKALAIRETLAKEVNQLKEYFSADPFTTDDWPKDLQERFFTSDGRILLRVLPAFDLTDRQSMTAFIQAVETTAPNIAGRSIVEWGVGETVKQAFVTASIIAIVSIFSVLVLYFRSVMLSLMVFVPVFMTLLFAFSLITLTDLTLNMANILVVPLIFGLGVDTGVHVVHRFFQSDKPNTGGLDSTERAVVISAVTTIGTFLSLAFSPHKGAASIGILLSASVLFMLIVTLQVLPALLSCYRNKAGNRTLEH